MRVRLRKVIVTASVVLALAGGAVALGVSGAAESWLFYFPSRRAFRDPPGVEAVTFKTADGLTLSAWYWEARDRDAGDEGATGRGSGRPVPHDNELPGSSDSVASSERSRTPARLAPSSDQWHRSPLPARPNADGESPTILVTHGDAGCLPDHDEFCAFLADHGFNVLLFDYRGYGRSDLPKRGLNRADLVLDTRAAFDYLLTRDDVDPDRIALLGYSLGGNIGLGFAVGEDRIRAVVTLATFSEWKAVAADHAGPLGRFLIPDGMNATDSVAGLGTRPLMIVHGDDDDIVPHRHADLLQAAAQGAGVPVTRLDVPGANHLNLTRGADVQRAIAEFLARATHPHP